MAYFANSKSTALGDAFAADRGSSGSGGGVPTPSSTLHELLIETRDPIDWGDSIYRTDPRPSLLEGFAELSRSPSRKCILSCNAFLFLGIYLMRPHLLTSRPTPPHK
jgi:hypothetical protein